MTEKLFIIFFINNLSDSLSFCEKILLTFLSNLNLLDGPNSRESILLIDDLGSELDITNLTKILKEILRLKNQIILTGIEGEEMHASIKKLVNFTQINL